MYDSSPKVPPKDNAANKSSKWQPLSTVEPEPITDNDPFSLGDSDDEKEIKDTKETKEAKETKPKDTKEVKDGSVAKEDDAAERVKKATAEAMADSLGEATKVEQTGDKKN